MTARPDRPPGAFLMPKRRSLHRPVGITAVAALAALSTLGLAACGSGGDQPSGTTSDRAAAGGSRAQATACNPGDERRSYARSLTVLNMLPVPISLTASDVSCAQWSGVSTPYAWSGVTLTGNESMTKRMEMARGTRPQWTFTVRVPKALTPFTVRCTNPDNACGYDVLGAPAGPWPDSVIIATNATPDWAATPEQRARIERMGTDQVVVWSDGSRVYVWAHTGDEREITDAVT